MCLSVVNMFVQNLRAQVYGIENVDRLKVKQIAGRIVPAIATTTAMVSGLATIELIKVMQKRPLEVLRNTFLNLALPMLVLSEPGPCVHSKLRYVYLTELLVFSQMFCFRLALL